MAWNAGWWECPVWGAGEPRAPTDAAGQINYYTGELEPRLVESLESRIQ